MKTLMWTVCVIQVTLGTQLTQQAGGESMTLAYRMARAVTQRYTHWLCLADNAHSTDVRRVT